MCLREFVVGGGFTEGHGMLYFTGSHVKAVIFRLGIWAANYL